MSLSKNFFSRHLSPDKTRKSHLDLPSILEAVGKLTIAWCIVINPIDRLIFFAAMVAVLAWIIRVIYASYCKRNFDECHYSFEYDHALLKRMFSFAGWTFLGNTAGILNSHGVNILSNMFFGVGVNAARGIAEKVNAVMTQFVNNFTTAINPQITKSYAQGDEVYMGRLMYSGARLSCYLYLFFAIPIGFEAEFILKLWLKIVPEYTVVFVRWTLASALCLVIGNSILTALLSTGDIKKYQIIISFIAIFEFPITIVAFMMGCSPTSAYILYFIMYFSLIFVRYYLVKQKVAIDFTGYIVNVVIKVILVIFIASILPLLTITNLEPSIYRFLLNIVVCPLSLVVSVLLFGLTKYEKDYAKMRLNKYIRIIHKQK